jgi:hypothetical protein
MFNPVMIICREKSWITDENYNYTDEEAAFFLNKRFKKLHE